jgi:hypothetical protein
MPLDCRRFAPRMPKNTAKSAPSLPRKTLFSTDQGRADDAAPRLPNHYQQRAFLSAAKDVEQLLIVQRP